jgi:hypothetical protein
MDKTLPLRLGVLVQEPVELVGDEDQLNSPELDVGSDLHCAPYK